MYDINLKNVKKGRGFFFMFFFIGFMFLVIIGGIFVSTLIKINNLDSETISSRVDVKSHRDSEGSTMYSPVYYFRVNGIEYSCDSTSSSSINPGDKNKTVYYDSKDPSNCMTEFSKSNNALLLLPMLIPLLFIGIAVYNFIKIEKRIKAINELNQKGKLIKNLPYRLEATGMEVNNRKIMRIVIDYTLPSGSVVKLFGDPRHDGKSIDADGMVDLVIDENDPNNYFIDFEINRLSGNLPGDYFEQSINNQQYVEQNNFVNQNNQINVNDQYNNYNNNY